MKLSSFLFVLLTLTSCAASQSPAPITPWKISVTSSGGLAGRGAGSYTIDSDGAVSVTTITQKTCTYTATQEERERFAALLAAARPASWTSTYIPDGQCCDRFEYQISVDRAGEVSKTAWSEESLPMPEDLVGLVDAVISGPSSLRMTYGQQCR